MLKDVELELYQSMYRIRASELVIRREYPSNTMKTPMHMSIGEEAITAGICTALRGKARFYGTYRSHALYLAVTGNTDGFFAELLCKSTGPAAGKAGSMHLASPDEDLVMTSAVVGTTIPAALGGAFEQKCNNSDKISVAFFGDGAVDEGVFWESLNMACLMKLPVLFVCEDNGLAIHNPAVKRRGYASLGNIAKQFYCTVYDFTGTLPGVLSCYDVGRYAYSDIKAKNAPALAILPYYRHLEHVGISEDFDAGYRIRDYKALALDPLYVTRQGLLERGFSTDVQKIEAEIDREIETSIVKAKEAPFPKPDDLYKGVFSG